MADSTHRLKTSLAAMLSRRAFVRGTGGMLALGAALYFGAKWRAALSEPSPWQRLEMLNQASFANLVGDNFEVEVTQQEKMVLHLVELKDLKMMAAQAGECFVLRLFGSSQQPLAQDTYMFHHAKLGTFPLFIVPAPPGNTDLSQHTYHANFNRLVA